MPKQYTIKAGDTLQKISITQCGSDAFIDQIAKDNHIVDHRKIFPGQVLIINCGDAPSATTPPTTTASAPPVTPTPPTPPATTPTPPTTVTTPPPTPSTPPPTPAKPSTPPAATTPATPPATTVTPPKPSPTGEVKLDVPYHSQEDLDAKWAAADCGPTCVHMVIDWRAKVRGQPLPNITTDQVSKNAGITPRSFSQFSNLMAAGNTYHLKLNYTRDAQLPRILAEIDAGRPVIMLIRYGNLSQRQNQAFGGGHFVVVIGYNSQEIILNDPDWWGTQRNNGAGFHVPRAEFEGAIGLDLRKTGNEPYQGLFVDPSAI
jgi:hypothetical protein